MRQLVNFLVYSVGDVIGAAVGSAVIYTIILIVVILYRQEHLLLHNSSTRNILKDPHVGIYDVICGCLQRLR